VKQFNVHDETHQLGKELSLRTGKSLLVLIHEALEKYKKSIEEVKHEDELVSRLLNEAAGVIVKRLCAIVPEVIHKEVPKAVKSAVNKLRRLQAEEFEKQKQEIEQILMSQPLEELAEGEVDETDDLKVVQYEDLYGDKN